VVEPDVLELDALGLGAASMRSAGVVGVCADAMVASKAVLASAAVKVFAYMCSSSLSQKVKKKHHAAIAVPLFPEFQMRQRSACYAGT
jgi:hypothetical protein